ncbi:MAG: 50S ribosomal protein L28 [Rickettsiales bacterium]|nr:50S ribosomal protein L28 [Rickettsiales bacterium]
MTRKCDLTGVGVMTGNNVSKSKRRTRRDFLPNLKEVVFKSDALGVDIVLKVTANVLRTINKYGNLDSFIINYRINKLTDIAKKLRNRIEKALIKKGDYENVKIVRKSNKRIEKQKKVDKKKK